MLLFYSFLDFNCLLVAASAGLYLSCHPWFPSHSVSAIRRGGSTVRRTDVASLAWWLAFFVTLVRQSRIPEYWAMPSRIRAVVVVSLLWLVPIEAQAQQRYLVQFLSGKRAAGNDIQNWHETDADPQLGNQRLFFEGDRPVWIEEQTIELAEPAGEFIEFVTGDRLPGEIVEYRTGRESPHRQDPPHFIVQVGATSDLPDARRPAGVPIVARWLKRIVWRKIPGVYASPGTVVYRDGRRIAFRSLRWSPRGVRVLLEDEARLIPIDELAEIYFPRADSWSAWHEQLATVAPGGKDLLIQVESRDGHRITTSMARLQVQNRDPRTPGKWYHGFQPAWALEPLWLNHRSIRIRRFFEPQAPLLTLLEPAKVEHKSTFGGSFPWQRDMSVRQSALRSGAQSFGWGLGVQAYSALSWDLPPLAVAFSSLFGLDLAAGSGGCVHCAVYGGPPSGKPLYQSPVLVGSGRTGETGRIALPEAREGKRQLTLVVDPQNEDHPEGADPFEIRDLFDWLEPQLELDPQLMRRDLSLRAASLIPAWQDWKLAGADDLPALVSTRTEAVSPKGLRYATEIAPRSESFSLTRQLEVARDHRALLLGVSRSDRQAAAARLLVKIDGETVGNFEIPLRGEGKAPDPLHVSLDRWKGKRVQVELTQSGGPTTRAEWSGIGLLTDEPDDSQGGTNGPP